MTTSHRGQEAGARRSWTAGALRSSTAGAQLLLLPLLLATFLGACDRRSVRAPGKADPGVVGGPQSVDGGVRFTYEDPAAQSVHLSGSFNNWSTSADPMVRDAAGRWTIVRQLAPGTYSYKFVVNGGAQWVSDPHNPMHEDDGFGGKNSVLQVDASGVQMPQAQAPAQAAPSGTPAATDGGPKKVEGGWLFAFEAAQAQTVHLAGTFNSWSTSADPMQKGNDGVWVLVKPLTAGTYQYKFVINGGQTWKEDPTNPNSTDDGYGGKNSVLVIP